MAYRRKHHKKWRPLHEFARTGADGPDPIFSVEAVNKQAAQIAMKKAGLWSWWWSGRKIAMVPRRGRTVRRAA
jgi:hypothetical protein